VLLADTVFFSHLSLRMFELLCYFQMQVGSRSRLPQSMSGRDSGFGIRSFCFESRIPSPESREVRLQPDQIDLGMLTITTRGLIATPFEIETGARWHIASGHIMCSRIHMHSSRNEGCNQC